MHKRYKNLFIAFILFLTTIPRRSLPSNGLFSGLKISINLVPSVANFGIKQSGKFLSMVKILSLQNSVFKTFSSFARRLVSLILFSMKNTEIENLDRILLVEVLQDNFLADQLQFCDTVSASQVQLNSRCPPNHQISSLWNIFLRISPCKLHHEHVDFEGTVFSFNDYCSIFIHRLVFFSFDNIFPNWFFKNFPWPSSNTKHP